MKLKTLICFSLIALVASLSLLLHAQVFTVIHTFQGGSDGACPRAGLTLRDGIFYGTTSAGGNGTVYQIMPSGSNWVKVPVSYLTFGGYNPLARVVFGPDSHLYGTTPLGGSCPGGGVVFDLIPPASICKTAACLWKEGLPWQFGCGSDGANPGFGDVVWDRKGSMYGTTTQGGDFGSGTLFQMQPSGNSWTESIIWSFEGQPDGLYPENGVIIDSNDSLYGTTQQGGSSNFGTVFKLSYVVRVGWTETVLYNFQNGSDGSEPVAGLVSDSSGNLYGATTGGGSRAGTIFELSPSGDSYIFRLLYSFSGPSYCGPYATLTMDNSGSLYGTTLCDGANGFGNIFKLSNTQNGWIYNSLYDFTYSSDGAYPYSNVTIDQSGNLFGTAIAGGNLQKTCGYIGDGIIWMIKP